MPKHPTTNETRIEAIPATNALTDGPDRAAGAA
jgi:hypothetical protein